MSAAKEHYCAMCGGECKKIALETLRANKYLDKIKVLRSLR